MAGDDMDAALDLFARSGAMEPERIAVWSNLAEIQSRAGRYDEAQHSINTGRSQLEQQRSELPEAVHLQHRQRLRALQLQVRIGTGQLAEAEHWLERLDETGDETGIVHWRCLYSNQLAGHGHHAQAEEVLTQGLKLYPGNVPLLTNLAELAQIQGRFPQAVQALNRAIRHDETNPRLWARLSGACLINFGRRAREAAEKAVELAEALPEDDGNPPESVNLPRLLAKNALAQVESQEQNFDVAERLFREILDTHPNFVPALRGLAQQQMQRGNIDEAVALYERIKTIDPVTGYTALINARHFPEDDETLEKLEKAARTPSLEGPTRSGILFQLAAAHEKRRDYDRAFGFAVEANAISRRFLRYDPKEHRNRCARIRHGFGKALYRHRPECGVDSTLPVYVLGMPRSGTTLVEQIIAGHSRIFGAGELGVIPGIIQGLNRWERHVGSGRTYPDCVDDLTPYVVAGIANNVLKGLREYDPEARHIVDKLPHNFENVGLIKFLFPKAKIISVRRDPRDIAISNFFTDYQAKHGGMGFAYDLTDIGQQLADHNLLMHHWHQLFPSEILDIDYEAVVADVEGAARRMLDYIGVDWEPAVLAFDKLERPVKTASVWQVRQPIYRTSTARWMHYREHIAPLIAGANARIEPDPVEMITLPEPGFLTDGFALYQKGDLDGAEYLFKKMLHHNPDHAACNYMVGEIYLRKNHIKAGIERIEKALEKAPWKREWRDNLLTAMEKEQGFHHPGK
uniref:Tetratricopeptide repeat-containing protein n=1 Tax=Candidatus Kentrum sp. DK TaxID=2126562 RepID=A0A450T8C5_9GAMM|nr:MAG: Tetratricopeptide repeat-containing protein [Candidatus Kentron sp. DK]